MKNLVSNEEATGKLEVLSWAPRWWAVFLIGLALGSPLSVPYF